MPDHRLTLILGGARSGKSRRAEQLVMSRPGPWTYVATAQAFDDEMRLRIAEHRQRRGEDWTTIEAPLDLPETVRKYGRDAQPMLIDCLTLWLSNVMLAAHCVDDERDQLIAALAMAACPIVIVSNEVGLGIVPENALARTFRDAQGRLNQNVAELAGHVVLMAAGLPLVLKPSQ